MILTHGKAVGGMRVSKPYSQCLERVFRACLHVLKSSRRWPIVYTFYRPLYLRISRCLAAVPFTLRPLAGPPLPLSLKPSAGFPSPAHPPSLAHSRIQGGERASSRPRGRIARAPACLLSTPCSKGLATLSSSLSPSRHPRFRLESLVQWFVRPVAVAKTRAPRPHRRSAGGRDL